jgi:pSer/pThr/pTyr-binding forkhead associated (FHA) protein
MINNAYIVGPLGASVGRLEDLDIYLADQSVSRHHAEISFNQPSSSYILLD